MQAAQSVNKAKRQLRPESYFLEFFKSPAQGSVVFMSDGAVYLFTFNIPVFNICQSTTVSD